MQDRGYLRTRVENHWYIALGRVFIHLVYYFFLLTIDLSPWNISSDSEAHTSHVNYPAPQLNSDEVVIYLSVFSASQYW